MNCKKCGKELSQEDLEDNTEGYCRQCNDLEMDDLASNILYSPFSPL